LHAGSLLILALTEQKIPFTNALMPALMVDLREEDLLTFFSQLVPSRPRES